MYALALVFLLSATINATIWQIIIIFLVKVVQFLGGFLFRRQIRPETTLPKS